MLSPRPSSEDYTILYHIYLSKLHRMKSLYFRSNQLAINGLCCRRFLSLRSLLTRIATPLLNSSSKLKANQNEDQPTTLQDVKSLEPEKRRLQKFIPVTRRILFHKLLEEKRLLNSSEKRLMNNVAAALDAKFSQKFYRILEESKVLICLSQTINV